MLKIMKDSFFLNIILITVLQSQSACKAIRQGHDDQGFLKYRQEKDGQNVLVDGGIAYDPNDKSCYGFPRIWADSKEGTCVGMVSVSGADDNKLLKPRSMLQIPGSRDFLLTDMGGWNPGKGRLLKLEKKDSGYAIKEIEGLKNLNLPHALALGPEGKVFVGEDRQIFWIDPNQEKPQVNVVINGLTEADGKNKHPVTMFVFDNEFNLYVNIGAPSDQCESDSQHECRLSSNFAQLRFYKYKGDLHWDENFEVFASGLRNSMGLAFHKSGTILQAENSMDFKNEFEPFEELNIVVRQKHYGWPYCYDFYRKIRFLVSTLSFLVTPITAITIKLHIYYCHLIALL
ncbi:MAG: PQQ-dependent sugar dehydrogenase [Bdellovibrionota bacterium]